MTSINRRKVTPSFKQMAFETAVRNPERYRSILKTVKLFDDHVLNEETLLKVVSTLYLNNVVSSAGVEILEDSTIESISKSVVEVNSTRNSDGGFPRGYCSRFWTYMRTLSELGFVYSQYKEPLKLSEIANMLIENQIDEQEAFSVQAMKYNRKSPYRNILNDFNYFRFVIEILKQQERITYEQFVVSTFSNDGNVVDFLKEIHKNGFNNNIEVEDFVRTKYGSNNKEQTILRDYPDVVLRLLIISGFVSIQYRGRLFIYLNIDKLEYINDLLAIPIELSETEKQNPTLHFSRLESYNRDLLAVVIKHKQLETKIDAFDYTKKVASIIDLMI